VFTKYILQNSTTFMLPKYHQYAAKNIFLVNID